MCIKFEMSESSRFVICNFIMSLILVYFGLAFYAFDLEWYQVIENHEHALVSMFALNIAFNVMSFLKRLD